MPKAPGKAKSSAELWAGSSMDTVHPFLLKDNRIWAQPQCPKSEPPHAGGAGCSRAVTSVTSPALALLECPSSQAVSECSTQTPTFTPRPFLTEADFCCCCCFHFYHLYYRSLINGFSFTHVRIWKKSPNYLVFPSVMEQGEQFAFHSFLFFLFIYVIYHLLSAAGWKNHFLIIKISHTPTLNYLAFFSLKLEKYSFETMFHFQMVLRKVWISA